MDDSARNSILNPDNIRSVPFEGGWLVGFVFEGQEDGERGMRAIAESWNTMVRAVAEIEAGKRD